MSNTETTSLEKALNHFGAKITDTWSKDCDFFIYEESTADGYSVFVATDSPDNISINDDIYYYDGDLGEAFTAALVSGECKNIYLNSNDDFWLDEAVSEILNEIQANIDITCPDWFDGEIYEEGGEVTNPFNGVTAELNSVELSIYDFIIGAQLLLELNPSELSDNAKDQLYQSLIWFKENNEELSETLINNR